MDYKLKFCVELKSVVNLICREMAQQPACNGEDTLSSMQVWVIEYLYENQHRDIFQRDLEADFNVRRSTVSGILQNLEKKGLIIRESVNQDARLKKISLTKDAILVHKDMLQKVAIMEEKMTENISEEEWIAFYKVLDKIKKNLK
ncbi:MarR family winged helix-turn-helix transcriptional regulator [Anaerotignum sp.]|uniref:MarR family winged helix-turn-helix transcriptional regulator n=1 Tax=Anaerotignum sp. TaxID=2039241 RepID=UPI0028AE5EED|nr:MarR family transcriptional regulator [Anaerotignum sp.]